MTKLVRLSREFRLPQENGDVRIWPAGWAGEVNNSLAVAMQAQGAEILPPPQRIEAPQPGRRVRGGNKYGGLSSTGDGQPPLV